MWVSASLGEDQSYHWHKHITILHLLGFSSFVSSRRRRNWWRTRVQYITWTIPCPWQEKSSSSASAQRQVKSKLDSIFLVEHQLQSQVHNTGNLLRENFTLLAYFIWFWKQSYTFVHAEGNEGKGAIDCYNYERKLYIFLLICYQFFNMHETFSFLTYCVWK